MKSTRTSSDPALFRIIRTESHYARALEELERLLEHPDAEKSGRIGDDIELLSMLVEKYEEAHFPIGEAKPVEILRYVMEQRDLAQKDLAPMFGGRARVSDFFAGRRGLSATTIVALNRGLHIPVELLIDKTAKRKPRGLPKSRRSDGASIASERSARYRSRRRK